MPAYEYTAIPAPLRSEKAKAKSPSERYATTLTGAINAMAAKGWEYLRAETLPSEERSGLTGRTTVFHNLLIFRRETEAVAGMVTEAEAETAARPVSPVFSAPPLTPPAAEPAAASPAQDAPEKPAEDQAPASPVFSEKMRPAAPASAAPKEPPAT